MWLQQVCNVWFMLEFTVRFVVCPNKCIFARSPVNIIDLVATLSFYTDILLQVRPILLLWSLRKRAIWPRITIDFIDGPIVFLSQHEKLNTPQ